MNKIRQMKRTSIYLTALLLSMTVMGQQRTISGSVKDIDGEPLIGASVMVKGTSTGVITDINGSYELTLSDNGSYVIETRYVGFKTQSKKVTIQNDLNASLDFTLAEGTNLDEVTVIGSRNQSRTALETAVPIDLIPLASQVESAAQVEVGEILNYLAPSFSANNQTIADGTDHVNPASLRGLGIDHVLVLINGKRRHTSSLVNVNGSVGRGSVGTDLNAIPAAAIERIEVLRDGAAAQYGSDAIAGVINIVLKEDVDKVYFSSTVGTTSKGDGERAQVNLNYGLNIGKKGFINLTGQYQFRGRTDRAGAWTGDVFKTDGTGVFAEDFSAGDFSPFDLGKRLSAEEAASINAANAKTNNMTDAEQEALINANGGRRAFSMKVGQSEVTNSAMMLNSAYEISENAEFYLFGGLNFRKGLATGFYRLPNQSRTLTSLYPNGFLPEINSNIFDGSIAGGIRGKVNGWDVDFGNAYGINSFDFLITNTNNASRGSSSPTSFDAGGFSFAQNTSNLDFTRYFSDALKGVNIAFGAMYRVETYSIFAGEEGSYRNYGNVDVIDTLNDGTNFSNEFNQVNIMYSRPGGSQVFPGFQPDNELRRSRGNLGLYFDTELQFTEGFFINLATRYENYTDFGNTFNWKVASRYDINDKLAVRGAYSTGFRAPSLHQRYFNSTSTLFQINSAGVNVPNEIGTFSNDSRIATLFGIPNLTNEKSRNASLGFTFSILDNLNLTVDGYYIEIDDRVVLTSAFNGDGNAKIQDILDRANAGSASFFVNGIDTETSGIDFILTHDAQLGNSTLSTSLAANFTKTDVSKINIPSSLTESPDKFFNREERNRFEDATPQSKINLTFDVKMNKLFYTLRFVRFGEVFAKRGVDSDESTWIDNQFSPKIITDLSVGYKITKNLSFVIGANNLFDVYPDENREEDRSNERFVYSRRATQFGFNGSYYFGRINFTL